MKGYAVILTCLLVLQAAAWYEIHSLTTDGHLPELRVSADHYGLGVAVGKSFKERIKNYIDNYDNLNQVLIPYFSTPAGNKTYADFIIVNIVDYPHYFEEIRGLAAGSEQPQFILTLLAFEDELSALAGVESLHCTDIFTTSPSSFSFLGHNEDADALVQKTGFFVHASIVVNNQHQYDFSAYWYPGYIPGIAYGWNSYGLVFSQNAVFPKHVDVGGKGDNFLSRDAYSAKSVPDLISKVTASPVAYGFSFNVGELATGNLYNIEVSADGTNVYQISKNYSHTNMYKRLSVPQSSDPSSIARELRINEFPIPKNALDIEAILGDTQNSQYPIYRNGSPPDTNIVTCTTTIFDLQKRTCTVYTANPLTSSPWRIFQL